MQEMKHEMKVTLGKGHFVGELVMRVFFRNFKSGICIVHTDVRAQMAQYVAMGDK